ncbi:SH3 domain-containing protein [Desulfosarcina sp. OttesenSCG-928-G17]|nr:SH3 domain-containing protein [Desulfosarcina sp. OttesenSCG-928-G17]
MKMRKHRIVICVGVIAAILLTGTHAFSAERMSVGVPIANVRSGSNGKAAVLWQVEQYQPLNVIQKSGEWYLCEDFEGDRGWVHNTLLSRTATVVVKANLCNVRSSPGTNAPIQFTVDKGVPFKVLEKKNGWYNVVHADGDKGWIHGPLVW